MCCVFVDSDIEAVLFDLQRGQTVSRAILTPEPKSPAEPEAPAVHVTLCRVPGAATRTLECLES